MTKAKSGARMGRPCVFRDKENGQHVHGLIRKVGAQAFERARAELAKLAPHVKNPSDADVIEYLAIGKAATKAYIREHS